MKATVSKTKGTQLQYMSKTWGRELARKLLELFSLNASLYSKGNLVSRVQLLYFSNLNLCLRTIFLSFSSFWLKLYVFVFLFKSIIFKSTQSRQRTSVVFLLLACVPILYLNAEMIDLFKDSELVLFQPCWLSVHYMVNLAFPSIFIVYLFLKLD